MVKLLVELFGVGLIVAGVGLWSVPLALIVLGVIVIAAVEVRA